MLVFGTRPEAIYPIHMNPVIREVANEILRNDEKNTYYRPLDVLGFHKFFSRSYLILTDFGGIQEEAHSLGKPVLVMRDTTKRLEGIATGMLKLAGIKEENIYKNFKLLLEDEEKYLKMNNASNPYSDGFVSKRIADVLGSK